MIGNQKSSLKKNHNKIKSAENDKTKNRSVPEKYHKLRKSAEK